MGNPMPALLLSALVSAASLHGVAPQEEREIHQLIRANDPRDLPRLEELVDSNLPYSLVVPEGGMGGRIPLCNAAYFGNLDAVKLLLRLGASVEGRGERGAPLRDAASMGHAGIVFILLTHGADVNAAD